MAGQNQSLFLNTCACVTYGKNDSNASIHAFHIKIVCSLINFCSPHNEPFQLHNTCDFFMYCIINKYI